MNIILTASRFWDNPQVVYHILTHEINPGDKIILTGAKAPFQDPIKAMADKMEIPCEYMKEVLVDDNTDFIKLEDYERELMKV